MGGYGTGGYGTGGYGNSGTSGGGSGSANSTTPTPNSQLNPLSAVFTNFQLAENNDPAFCDGPQGLLSGTDAVAQAIYTRLLLFEGEWWEDQTEGTPLWQKILGVGGISNSLAAVTLVLQQRVQGTPYVTSVVVADATFTSSTRDLAFAYSVETQFGLVPITNIPMPPSQGLPNG